MSDSHPLIARREPGVGVLAVRLAALAVGAAALWAQLLVVRAGLVAFGGNELVLALLFGYWLCAVGLGALAGGAAARRVRLEPLLCATFLLFAGMVFWEYLAARGLRGLIGLPAGECPRVAQAAAGLALITVPVSALIGFAFPPLAAARRALGKGAGEIYALEAAGSLGAALVGTYVFLPLGREDLLAFGATAALLLAACVVVRRKTGLACAGLLALWACVGTFDLQTLAQWGDTLRWRGLLGGFRLERTVDTPYGNLTVLGRAGQHQVYFDGQLAFAFPDDIADETEAFVAGSQALHQRAIAVVGGSPGLARELLKYAPTTLYVVPLDPALPDVLAPFVSAEDAAAGNAGGFVQHRGDARAFFRTLQDEALDLVVLALPEPTSAALNRFYTREFLLEIERTLAREGVLAMRIEVGIHLQEESASYAAALLRTLRTVFPEVVVTAGGTVRFFASKAGWTVTSDGALLASRFDAMGFVTRFFRKEFFLEDEAFRPGALARTRERLESAGAGPVPIESDARPTLFVRRLVLDARAAGSALAGFFGAVLDLAWWQVLPWALVPGMVVLLMRRRRTPAVLVAVGGTGLWGMACAMMLLFAFQIVSGSVYHKVGMLTGAFMCGVSAGAWRGRRCRRPGAVLVGAEIAALVTVLATPFVVTVASDVAREAAANLAVLAEAELYLWSGLLGAVTGVEFSAANLFLLRGLDARGHVAALTDGADHLGACVGALVTGLVLLPSLGIAGAALFLALLKAGTLGGLAAALVRRGGEASHG